MQDAIESLRLVWPAYFADPENAPPVRTIAFSVEAYSGIIGEMTIGTDRVAAMLANGSVRYGIVAGGARGQAAQTTAELSPHAFLEVVPGAGHFIWYEAPGRVLAALRRLSDGRDAVGPPQRAPAVPRPVHDHDRTIEDGRPDESLAFRAKHSPAV